eukprot:CAMPEP_0172441934 /NCGR_PEP_ID=MMETSP1065-20121228/2442_1 /TAXON_ID=265537 /ORGANISM="Amphiprora paludosa, Strain CCMP125" /LENGTH=257 /DNA_ID=CAMNT_0013191563 /DNA_START=154 /DNA_END=924 /DNA_ORIENTATION=+
MVSFPYQTKSTSSLQHKSDFVEPDDFENAHALVNRERKLSGNSSKCHPLRQSSELDSICQAHAQEMAKHEALLHSAKNLEDLKDKVQSHDAGETLLRGSSVSEMHQRAMSENTRSSRTSRRTILHDKFLEMGVGTAWGADGKLYMVQLFRGDTKNYHSGGTSSTKTTGSQNKFDDTASKKRMFLLVLGSFLIMLLAMALGSGMLPVTGSNARSTKVPLFVSGSRKLHYHHQRDNASTSATDKLMTRKQPARESNPKW